MISVFMIVLFGEAQYVPKRMRMCHLQISISSVYLFLDDLVHQKSGVQDHTCINQARSFMALGLLSSGRGAHNFSTQFNQCILSTTHMQVNGEAERRENLTLQLGRGVV